MSQLQSLELNYTPHLIGKMWQLSVTRNDPFAVDMYLRHYSSTKTSYKKSRKQIGGPGQYIALMTAKRDALFLWTQEKFRRDGQTGINCTIFRNESQYLSSDLIHEACIIAWRRWPDQRLYTFVDPSRIRSSNPGYCFKSVGWQKIGVTKSGLLIFEKTATP